MWGGGGLGGGCCGWGYKRAVQRGWRMAGFVGRTDPRGPAARWGGDPLPAGAVVAELGSGPGSSLLPDTGPDLPPGIRRAGAGDLARGAVTHVVTHEHHQLPFSRL